MRQSRFFGIMLVFLSVILIAGTVALLAFSDYSGIRLHQFADDGTVMFGPLEKSILTRPPIQAAFQIPLHETRRPERRREFTEGERLTFAELYEKAAPAVALIISSSDLGITTATGAGSGIIITDDGYIVTNHHVVDNSSRIAVVLYNGLQHEAEIIGTDRTTDLAVLRIRAQGLPYLLFGTSETVRPGDPVAVIGNPFGAELSNTITTGTISGINRDITIEGVAGDISMNALQTNSAVNPGNSGGPLLDEFGKVIGIISSKIMGVSTQAEGLGFAIPSDVAIPIVEQLIEYGFVRGRPALGVTVDLTYIPIYGMPPGVRVVEVDERTDAYAKGLRPGDIIIQADGTPTENISELNEIRNAKTAGDTLHLVVFRMGTLLEFDVILMEEGGLSR